MKYLLDTHALLWFLLNDNQLSARAMGIIVDGRNDILASPASYWEIAIKISLGKYSLNQPFTQFFQKELFKNKIGILPIEIPHAAIVSNLPFHHRDPFDRLIIGQAIAENLTVLSNDGLFDHYPVNRIW